MDWLWRSAIPRIQDLRAGRFEIGDVAGNDRHAMSESRRRDERITVRCCGASRHFEVDAGTPRGLPSQQKYDGNRQ